MGHDELLRNLGDNMLAFIENLDYIHTYMMTEFPDINMPSFRYTSRYPCLARYFLLFMTGRNLPCNTDKL